MDTLIWYGKDVVNTLLPPGKEDDNHKLDVELRVVDSYFGAAITSLTLQVIVSVIVAVCLYNYCAPFATIIIIIIIISNYNNNCNNYK